MINLYNKICQSSVFLLENSKQCLTSNSHKKLTFWLTAATCRGDLSEDGVTRFLWNPVIKGIIFRVNYYLKYQISRVQVGCNGHQSTAGPFKQLINGRDKGQTHTNLILMACLKDRPSVLNDWISQLIGLQ